MVNAVIIVSGGLDSVTLLHYLVKKEQIKPAVISFMYGQKHDKEIAFAKLHAEQLNCPKQLTLNLNLLQPLFAHSALVADNVAVPDVLEVMGDPQPITYVPNRNMIFLSLAAAYAETLGVTDVYYGAQKHDVYGYWDTTPQFLERMNQLLALNRKTPLEIKAPFVQYSKTEIVRLGLELGIDYRLTWSCYEGQELACGRCPTCAERLKAFADLGRVDPLPYTSKV
jgi:7-cyano-7-deazaguanine synthase